jgi:hypothetical protein
VPSHARRRQRAGASSEAKPPLPARPVASGFTKHRPPDQMVPPTKTLPLRSDPVRKRKCGAQSRCGDGVAVPVDNERVAARARQQSRVAAILALTWWPHRGIAAVRPRRRRSGFTRYRASSEDLEHRAALRAYATTRLTQWPRNPVTAGNSPVEDWRIHSTGVPAAFRAFSPEPEIGMESKRVETPAAWNKSAAQPTVVA